ncbi:hypothetical protein H0R92_03775 [Treponema sp. OMZ 840]|uniref:hypothetical protein n=1 Tax=Treponema sp. OMZ 840 TaxID=244313 RepID=UPI003D90CAE4
MKNKIKIITAAVCLLFLSAAVFATENVKEPGKSYVMLVGRVSMLQDIDRDFYIKTLDLDPALKDKAHVYGFLPNPKYKDLIGVPIDTIIGDYFFIPVKIPKDGTFPLDGFFVFLFTQGAKKIDVAGNIYKARSRHIFLPFFMDVKITGEDKYIYIGSYEYSFAGDNFVVDNIKTRDEFDEAQALLNTKLGKEVPLTRAVLLKPEKKADK